MEDGVKLPKVPWKNFFAGGIGGMCLVMAGHPFDTIKVRLQTATRVAKSSPEGVGGTSSYSGAVDCFKQTWTREGIRGFYKGMGTPLVMVTPLFAVGFFGYGVGKNMVEYLSPQKTRPGEMMSPFQLFCAGAISSCFTVFLVTPVERIKCLLQVQVQGSSSAYKGPWHCGGALLKEGGIRSLYKGFGSTFTRGIPQAGLYYMTYDVLKLYMGKGQPLSTPKTLVAGGLTGIINWAFVLPLDVVKSKIQTDAKGQFPRGARDVWPHILKTEGIKGLYRGLVPVFIRAFPANAACFMGFESAMKFINFLGL